MNKETREGQVLALTQTEREEGGEENPILYAESGPNRFASISLFFPEEDGVRVEEDLELNEITAYYFNEEGEIELTTGALYEWAINFYRENY